MEESKLKEKMCWSKEVDQNLKRLQSLLFDAELLQKQGFAAAYVLSSSILTHSEVDEAFTCPIRNDAVSRLDSARRALVQESDRLLGIRSEKLSERCIYGTS